MATDDQSCELLKCPLCSYQDEDPYALNLHVEHIHFREAEDLASESSTIAYDEPSNDWGDAFQQEALVGRHLAGDYVPCPQVDCGEQVRLMYFQEHLDFHLAERLSLEDVGSPSFPQRSDYNMYPYSKSLFPYFVPSRDWLHSYAYTKDTEYCVQCHGNICSCNDSEINPDAESVEAIHPTERQGLARKSGTSNDEDVSIRAYAAQSRHYKRLGREELGPFHDEKQMPPWLYKLLAAPAPRVTTQRIGNNGRLVRTTVISNQATGMIPLLGTLLAADDTVYRAWLCHDAVQYVFKLPREGSFCGYRNMQMLLSFVLAAGAEGAQRARVRMASGEKRGTPARPCGRGEKIGNDDVPGVLELQEWIEEAWDRGLNEFGKIETGGVRGTRKYVGTAEVQAMLNLLDIPCTPWTLTDIHTSGSIHAHTASHLPANNILKAHEQLVDQVEQYFAGTKQHDAHRPTASWSPTNLPPQQITFQNNPQNTNPKITYTKRAPLFLQQPGHSLTVIGLEIRADGNKNLLVLDPAYKPSVGIEKLLERRRAGAMSEATIAAAMTPIKSGNSGKQNAQVELRPGGGGFVRRKRDNSSGSGASTMSDGSTSSRSWKSGSESHRGSRSDANGSAGSSRAGTSRRGGAQASRLLDAYRRGRGRLQRFSEFEVVELVTAEDRGDEGWARGGNFERES